MSEQFTEESLTQETNPYADLYWPAPELLIEGTKTWYETPLDGLYFNGAEKRVDPRGLFVAPGVISEIEKVAGEPFSVAQSNLSWSGEGVARGIHVEKQQKFVTVPVGKVLSVIVDCRPDSQTKGQFVKVLLGNSVDYGLGYPTQGALFIKEGLGNSFMVLQGVPYSDDQRMAGYSYLVSKEYSQLTPEEKIPLYMFDPALGIKWPTNLSIKEMLQLRLISPRDLSEEEEGDALGWAAFMERRKS